MYAHYQDLGVFDIYVGPFNSEQEVQAHVQFCKDRGDSGELLGIVQTVPEDEFVMTPEEDKEWFDHEHSTR